jgi:hypothetical protein
LEVNAHTEVPDIQRDKKVLVGRNISVILREAKFSRGHFIDGRDEPDRRGIARPGGDLQSVCERDIWQGQRTEVDVIAETTVS